MVYNKQTRQQALCWHVCVHPST